MPENENQSILELTGAVLKDASTGNSEQPDNPADAGAAVEQSSEKDSGKTAEATSSPKKDEKSEASTGEQVTLPEKKDDKTEAQTDGGKKAEVKADEPKKDTRMAPVKEIEKLRAKNRELRTEIENLKLISNQSRIIPTGNLALSQEEESVIAEMAVENPEDAERYRKLQLANKRDLISRQNAQEISNQTKMSAEQERKVRDYIVKELPEAADPKSELGSIAQKIYWNNQDLFRNSSETVGQARAITMALDILEERGRLTEIEETKRKDLHNFKMATEVISTQNSEIKDTGKKDKRADQLVADVLGL